MDRLDQLLTLQREQHRHDQVAHSDILCLPVKQRITHMTLHFAKYVGFLAQASEPVYFQKVLVDTLIISLASANALNIDLAARIRSAKNIGSFDDLSRLALDKSSEAIWRTTFVGMAAATGVMAKACESLDHVEKYDYREMWEQRIVDITVISLSALGATGVDFVKQVRNRWEAIEAKQVLREPRLEEAGEKRTQVVALVKR